MKTDLTTAARALWRGLRHARAAVDKSHPSLKHRNSDTSRIGRALRLRRNLRHSSFRSAVKPQAPGLKRQNFGLLLLSVGLFSFLYPNPLPCGFPHYW
jgi:hypothetical protein